MQLVHQSSDLQNVSVTNILQCNLYIIIIQFVCLFVCESQLKYAKNSHQSLRNYRNPPGKGTARIGVTRPVVFASQLTAIF